MAFNLPSAQELHTTSATTNAALIGSNLDLGIKGGGNLPINSSATEIQNQNASNANGPVTGLLFGLDGQNVLGSYDVSVNTRVLIWSIQFNAPNRIQVTDIARGGVTFFLGSGTDPKNNYISFKIGGNDTPFASSQNGPVTMCIDLADTSNNSSVGTFDPTDVSAYGFGTVHVRLNGNNFGICYFQRSFLLETTKGAANLPTFTGSSDFDDAVTLIQGDNYTNKIGNWVTKAGVSFFVPCPFSFGDGTSPITFNDNGVSVISPSANATNQENFRLTNDAMRVYLDTADNSSDTVTLSGNYTWGTPAEWNFDISNQSICTLSGTFSGMGNFKLGSSVESTAIFTLATGYSVVSKGANISSSTINGDLKLEGISVTYFNLLEVTGNLEFDTAGTYQLEKCDIASVTNTSGGTVTIQSTGSSIASNLSATIIIQDLRAISITNIVDGSRMQVFNVTTGLEVLNQVISGATSYNQTYAEGTDYTSGDVVRVRLTYTSGLTSYLEFATTTVATGTGWSVLAAQVVDSVYAAIGVNGQNVFKFVADYTGNDVDLNVNQNFTVGEFYAWWKWNLTFERGIRNFFGVITALDQANFRINDSVLSLYLDSTATTSVRQTDNRRIFREDLTYPVKQPTTSGYGIDVVWRNIVFVAPVNVSVPALSAAETAQLAQITSVKGKTDLLNFTGTDLKATLDGEVVTTDTASRDASKATTTVSSNMRGTDNANTVAPTTPPTVVEIRAGFVANDFKATTTIASNMRGTDGANTVAPDNATIGTTLTDLTTYTGSALPKIRAILVDSDELQQNQGNFATATGFSTFDPASDVVANVTLVDTTTNLTNGGGGGGLTAAQATQLTNIDTVTKLIPATL